MSYSTYYTIPRVRFCSLRLVIKCRHSNEVVLCPACRHPQGHGSARVIREIIVRCGSSAKSLKDKATIAYMRVSKAPV